MNNSIDFHEKIQHVERLLHKEEYTASAMRSLIVTELALRHVVTQHMETVEESVRSKIHKAVQRRDSLGKGIYGLTMGQLVRVVHESKFLDALLGTLKKDRGSLSIIDLENLTKLRNKFAHDGQEASPLDAELLLQCLKAFLTTFEIHQVETRSSSVKRVLILAANPKDVPRLRVDEEVREITEGLQRSQYRERSSIHQQWAVCLRDLRRAMLEHEPHIVHFSGYGEAEGITLEDARGQAAMLTSNMLSGLFELFADHVECVVLNACYSESQIDGINKYIEYVIGIRQGIHDNVAIEFAIGFYDALGAGRSIEDAFNFGCNAIQQYNIPQHLQPLLNKKPKNIPQSEIPEQSKQVSTIQRQQATSQMLQNNLSEWETKRLRQKFEHLQQQWDIVTQKVERLESQKLLETRIEETMRIEALIAEHLKEQERIEYQLHELTPQRV